MTVTKLAQAFHYIETLYLKALEKLLAREEQRAAKAHKLSDFLAEQAQDAHAFARAEHIEARDRATEKYRAAMRNAELAYHARADDASADYNRSIIIRKASNLRLAEATWLVRGEVNKRA